MQLRELRAKVLEAATAAALTTEINDFLTAQGSYTAESPERTFVNVLFDAIDSSHYDALVLYTE